MKGNYFNWYERIGKFGGIINKIKFDKYINYTFWNIY